MTATQPEKVNPAKHQSSPRGTAFLRMKLPLHDRSSMRTPIPTITRNAQNTGATGGTSSPNSARPRTSPSSECVRISDRPRGMVSA
jgi:hypothetical protein